MSNTLYTGQTGDKLYLQSGQFTSTLKTSEAITGIDTVPQGISWDETNTPWTGSQGDKLYLTSGQFTSTIKTSEYVFAIDSTPTDISWDGTNTPWSGAQANKLYLQSGQFTSTLKTSEALSSTSTEGVSWDGTNTPWTASGASYRKLYLQSGQFTSTLKTSEDVSGTDLTPRGISWDGTNTLWTGNTDDKLYLTSGQFTSTIKTSESIGAVENFPTGIETDDYAARVDEQPVIVAISCTATLGINATGRSDLELDLTATATTAGEAEVIPQLVQISCSATLTVTGGIPPTRDDTLWAGTVSDKLYLQSGKFSSTVKTSESIGSVDNVPEGISWDGTNTPWTGFEAKKLYLQSGQFTSTLKTSEDVSAVDTGVGGISWDGTNTPWTGNTDKKLYLQSGQFTSTIKTSESVSSIDTLPFGISWDGTNTPWSGVTDDKLYLTSGQFTSTLKTSEDVSAVDNTPLAISWDSQDTLWTGNEAQKLYLTSGQFTSTIKTSESVSSIDTTPRGIDTTLVFARLGEWKLASPNLTGTATLGVEATGIGYVSLALSATATTSSPTLVVSLLTSAAMTGTATAAADLSVTKKSTSLGQAFVTVDITVTMNATNPSLSGDLVDIGNNAVFQLTVNGDLLDFTQVTSCFHAFNVLNLDVGYDGKELTFEEFTGIGSATYAPEQDVTLEIDFSDGLGLTRLFTGRIKQRDHDGRNNNEAVSYTAIDYLQLADDLTAVGSDGYPQITWTAPTTVTTITSIYGTFVGSTATNFEVPINVQAPTKIRDAVQDLFTFNATGLSSIGIPTAIGAPGLEQFTGELPETVTVDAQGFASGLISLAGYQTGVKVLFDERQQAWTFPNLQTVPTVIVDIASSNMPELPFSVDTTDRYTAVRLYADITDENGLDDLIQDKSEIASLGGPLGFGKIERSEVTLSNYWLASLEQNWSLFTALYSDPTQIQGENYFVYRRFKLPEGTERPGFGLEAKAFAQYNQWGNVYWAPLEGVVNWPKRYFLAAYPAISRGNPWHPGQAIPAQAVKLAYVPAAIRYIPASSITSGGVPIYSGVATTAQRGDFSDELRYPTTGFEGTAFTDFGIQREYVSVVDRTEVTVENAKAMLDIRKDAVVSGEVPIEGDPIPELIGLGVKVLVQHPVKSTSIETFAAFVTNYSYEFGKRGQSTISLSTDIAGLVT